MNKLPPEWPKIVPAFILLLLFVSATAVCSQLWRGCSMAVTDKAEFQYDHNLPHAYEGHLHRSLESMQAAVAIYAKRHQGTLPPMQSAAAARTALRAILGKSADYRSRNPATQIPFTPNAALSGRKIGAVSNGGRAILFYDADPPAGYRESYYVTIKGAVGHVPVEAIPRLLEAAAAARAVSGKNGVFALSALPAGRAGVALKRPDEV